MAYGNYNNYNSYGNYNGNRSRSNAFSNDQRYQAAFRNTGRYGGAYRQAEPKKRSGAKSGIDKKGRMYVSGWKAGRQGLISCFAAPYRNTSTRTSESGRVWENWMFKAVNRQTGQELLAPCLYDKMTGKVIISKYGWVMNPKAPRGGYTGKFGGNKR